MGKHNRSPLLGYNHNVRYGGRILHVQTEDSGPANPHLFTHLFFEGSILATKRCQYDAAFPEDGVRALMQSQHKEILKELKKGLYDDRLEEFFAARGELFTAPGQEIDATLSPTPAAEAGAPMPQTDVPPPVPLSEVTPSPGPEVLDLDAIPTPAPDKLQTPEVLPSPIIHPNRLGPGSYTFRRPTRDIASLGPAGAGASTDRRRVPRPQPASAPTSPVVVQRRIVVGAGSNTPSPVHPMAPRPRRPGGGVPYVVQEGSHPNLLAGQYRAQGVPPARPMAGTAGAQAAPRTAAPPPPSQEAPSESPVSTRSLDDVILAYLSKGDRRP